MCYSLSEPPEIAISVSPPELPLHICLNSLTFAHHSQMEIISFDSYAFPLTEFYFL